jgi:hypothetical protein
MSSSDVRAAADLLKSAIDQHLAACEARTGEEDPTVQVAYDQLRAAAEAYDDALFDTYEEVTPFEFSPGPAFDAAEVSDDGVPLRIAVCQRRDFAVRSVKHLVEAGREILLEEEEDEEAEALTPVDALALYLDVHGIDAATLAADDIGLYAIGGTTWLVEQDVDDETLGTAPFAGLDETRVLHRMVDEVSRPG